MPPHSFDCPFRSTYISDEDLIHSCTNNWLGSLSSVPTGTSIGLIILRTGISPIPHALQLHHLTSALDCCYNPPVHVAFVVLFSEMPDLYRHRPTCCYVQAIVRLYSITALSFVQAPKANLALLRVKTGLLLPCSIIIYKISPKFYPRCYFFGFFCNPRYNVQTSSGTSTSNLTM